MNTTTKISLDFGQKSAYPVSVWAKQGDQETRFVEITPLDKGVAYTIEAGVTARLQATKPDGTTILDNCTISDGKITAELTAQVLAVSGFVIAEIGLYKGTELLSSALFNVEVQETAYDPNAPISSDEYNALVEALAEAEEFSENIPRDYLNITVEVADWSLEGTPTYPEFPYKADISIADATADDIPELVPSVAAAADGLLNQLADASTGVVTIYASAIPASDYTFLRITLRKENVQT